MSKRLRLLLVLLTGIIFSFNVSVSVLALTTNTDNPFGTITNPIKQGSLGPGGGLITLLNNVLRLVFVVAGIYAFLQIVGAGLNFMNAGGDAKKIEQAWSQIWQSLLGVVIVISSLAIAALAGQLLFGDATAILNPRIYGPGPIIPTITP
ncbi:MAG: hypothetical protein UV61_C0010G0022 [Candidatus Gottesmanbacteria bacterium GW2011_GWB1_43_11]|uniref:Uncharacterized protein n=1 Tax=Candidatus Gottesmanbacteria bacterium GW2011_GWB1_43_11 TaxID=1618446 RepID=A0A0G1ETQ0_9BACT|nr:MAG: hypothetical protein UV04_C0012G0022 [Candidatus Gottesmanbacteria bacterium GW2011_GWA2_42_16]KKS53538.1 MAG: hypothetical protein UV17_C0035G0023 [Candidatus Gottesmanbacteria bacterium GW2011_GWA1_42_26]KKS81212.1 MAG: hypothetical protein UV55_C0018G0022 [Candidatus Gottesmanbacteria bacterium GW2011_GWC1_43_10]KKS86471.1 MAG: hypothetical protein UV61_C0010G0022 [Candidatus Gottesmanbacteria bacterium GW2011_GWB1_43_11]HCM37453.1 hypothetical protein [Patescibacteria group bacteriu